MAVVEKIMQMRGQGMTEPQIARSLREEGLSPKEINESLSQSQIKSALNTNPEDYSSATSPQMQTPQVSQMQPSIMPQNSPTPQAFQQTMQPTTLQQQPPPEPNQPLQEAPTEPLPYPDQQPSPETYPPEQPYPDQQPSPETYPPEQPYDYYPEYQSADVETIGDIAGQMIEEKTQDLKKKVSALIKFKEDAGLELEKLNKKVEKIETEFNTLQTAILKKVGDYGEDIKNISKEMHTTQDSFSKMINPIVDNIRKTESPEEEEGKTSKARKKTRKSKADFEHYLR